MRNNRILSLSLATTSVIVFWLLSVSLFAQMPDDMSALPGRLDQFLTQIPQSKQPLATSGKDFVYWGSQYGVNPRLIVAISGAESSFGAHICTQDNAWNWFWEGPCPKSPFDSWESGIKTVSHFLHKSYLLKGYNTIPLIGAKYCATGCEHWIPGVTLFYTELGGDTANLEWPLQSGSVAEGPRATGRARATILAKVTSTAMGTSHWWQKSTPSMTVEVQATVRGATPLAGSVKLFRISPPQAPQYVTTLRAQGSDDQGDMIFAGQASLQPFTSELNLQVTAGFPRTNSAAVASNLVSLTIVPPQSESRLFLLLAAGILLLCTITGVMIFRLKRTKPPRQLRQAA